MKSASWFVVIGLLFFVGAIGAAHVQQSNAEPHAFESLKFLTGTWRGEMNGEFVEEIWSAPAPGNGRTMIGMFRWLNADGQPRMYELLTLSYEDGETVLRLRHYTSKMIAWEDKDAPLTLRLTESSRGRAVFVNVNDEDRMKRIVFNQPQPRKLEIDVDFGEDRTSLQFRFDLAEQVEQQ